MEKVLWNGRDYTIEYLKTSISINAYVGCYLGCEYCILSSLEFPERPLKIFDEESLVEQLLQNQYFTHDITPISINNKSDPLLREVKQSTMNILKILERYRLQNPIYLISKLELTDEDLEYLDSLNLNIYVFFSFSGLDTQLEKVTISYQERRIRRLAQAKNIKKIHYWRPLIAGENDSEEQIRHMLEVVSPVFNVSIVSGLRVNETVNERFSNLNKNVPFNEYTKKHKYVEKEVFERVNRIRNDICPDYLLFRHTSCITSYWLGKPDFLHNDRKPLNCTVFNCPNHFRCSNRQKPPESHINEMLFKISRDNEYEIRDDHIMFSGAMSQEDLSFLNLNLGFKALSEKKLPTVSESVIEVV
ncbi:hypothetical protein MJA45_18760 [Paenibacillus aurantius]|uniref:Radical SAM core domain-containing protein n=1 Tax=Paenibacillus aurantius TaxID=2918900 RepID=A0AA96RDZ8_9BACL|nr:hypothetical protein [Paenibacillus aurantius]WNQ09658.1 hypothetical protein MJA45_18760 [Paenibacillus aurantius]